MIQYENIQKAMGIDIAVSSKMANTMHRWQRMYLNRPYWCSEDIKGLNLPAAISSEIARLVTMESKISITGSKRADIIKDCMQHFIASLPAYVEYACSTGGIIFKPYIDTTGIAIDIVKSGDFYPVRFDSAGNVMAVIFPEYIRAGKKLYVRLEYQSLENGVYTIANKAFVSTKAIIKNDEITNLGQEIELSNVPEWEDIEPYVELHNADSTLFSYFKIPLANNIDPDSPLGVSVYARAENQIKDADEQYGATLWEYKSKETAIQAADEFFKKSRDGKAILPKGKERLYHAMGSITSIDGRPFFNAYSPQIRDESFFNGYNRIAQKIEFSCGLAYGTLSDPQSVDKTAEEIKASKQRSYATVKQIQNSLGDSIQKLVQSINAWLEIEGAVPPGIVDVSIDWDDSLIVDKKYDTEQLRADYGLGVVGAIEYRMKRFNETKDQAIEMLKLAAEFDLEGAAE